MAFSTINCQNYYKSGATRDAKNDILLRIMDFTFLKNDFKKIKIDF